MAIYLHWFLRGVAFGLNSNSMTFSYECHRSPALDIEWQSNKQLIMQKAKICNKPCLSHRHSTSSQFASQRENLGLWDTHKCLLFTLKKAICTKKKYSLYLIIDITNYYFVYLSLAGQWNLIFYSILEQRNQLPTFAWPKGEHF